MSLSNRDWPALLTFSLLLGLVAPFAPVAAAAQPGSPLPPPLPAPNRVALSGTFQTALGCAADLDPSCPQTQLQNNRDGSWSAVLPVPPGDYTFRVLASSDQDRSLGVGGDPNGADLTLSVPGDAAGAYFAYDSLSGEITAEPVAGLVTLATDLGEQLAMAPVRQGGYEVTWDAQPGTYGFQILVNGQPVAQDTISLDLPAGSSSRRRRRRGHDKDTLRDTTLDVSAVDAQRRTASPAPASPSSTATGRFMPRTAMQTTACRTVCCDSRAKWSRRRDYTLRETFTPTGGTLAATSGHSRSAPGDSRHCRHHRPTTRRLKEPSHGAKAPHQWLEHRRTGVPAGDRARRTRRAPTVIAVDDAGSRCRARASPLSSSDSRRVTTMATVRLSLTLSHRRR